MSLAAIVALATMFTGQPCAAIDNTTNTAAWARPHHGIVTSHYSDNGDLRYERHVPRGRTLEALKRAEDALGIGAPGPKTVMACA